MLHMNFSDKIILVYFLLNDFHISYRFPYSVNLTIRRYCEIKPYNP